MTDRDDYLAKFPPDDDPAELEAVARDEANRVEVARLQTLIAKNKPAKAPVDDGLRYHERPWRKPTPAVPETRLVLPGSEYSDALDRYPDRLEGYEGRDPFDRAANGDGPL